MADDDLREIGTRIPCCESLRRRWHAFIAWLHGGKTRDERATVAIFSILLVYLQKFAFTKTFDVSWPDEFQFLVDLASHFTFRLDLSDVARQWLMLVSVFALYPSLVMVFSMLRYRHIHFADPDRDGGVNKARAHRSRRDEQSPAVRFLHQHYFGRGFLLLGTLLVLSLAFFVIDEPAARMACAFIGGSSFVLLCVLILEARVLRRCCASFTAEPRRIIGEFWLAVTITELHVLLFVYNGAYLPTVLFLLQMVAKHDGTLRFAAVLASSMCIVLAPLWIYEQSHGVHLQHLRAAQDTVNRRSRIADMREVVRSRSDSTTQLQLDEEGEYRESLLAATRLTFWDGINFSTAWRAAMSLIVEPFERKYYWFWLVDWFERALMAAIAAFANTKLTLILLCVITLLSSLLSCWCRAYDEPRLDVADAVAKLSNLVVFIVGLLLNYSMMASVGARILLLVVSIFTLCTFVLLVDFPGLWNGTRSTILRHTLMRSASANKRLPIVQTAAARSHGTDDDGAALVVGRVCCVRMQEPLGAQLNWRQLDLSNMQLTGDFPWSAIVRVSSIERLQLGGSNKWQPGALPSNLGDMRNLRNLDLYRMRVGGSIPNSISQLRLLEGMDLTANKLTGKLPWDAICSLGRLKYCNLQDNKFDASEIPSSIGNLSRLEELYVSHCQLRGHVPWDAFARLRRLKCFFCNGNAILDEEVGEICKDKPWAEHDPLGLSSDAVHRLPVLAGAMYGDGTVHSAPIRTLRKCAKAVRAARKIRHSIAPGGREAPLDIGSDTSSTPSNTIAIDVGVAAEARNVADI